uniref:Uncharacterized protein LOC104219417 n=1 Tax=Nicotiana sylvestris TaxID=4096 RepID=A0A1U7VTY8_NICSY|nr:PREDICTED: uncharacterized protein LOC104219417 [Nicotiana sylvestris]
MDSQSTETFKFVKCCLKIEIFNFRTCECKSCHWKFLAFACFVDSIESYVNCNLGLQVVSSTKYLHTVNDEGRYYIVCLLEKKGSCGRFQIDELPCPHAWAVLKSKFLMPEGYCSDYYKPKSVVMTYEVLVYPLPDQKEWNIPAYVADEVVLPPKWKRPPGRPKKKRDKPFIELLQKKNQHSCSICGQE